MYTITYKGAGGIWVVAHGIIAVMAHPDNYEAVNKLMRFYHIEPAQACQFDSFAWFLRFVDAYLGTGTKYFDAGKVQPIYK